MGLGKTADRQAKIYFAVGELLEQNADIIPDVLHRDYEDYRSEFYKYDIWTENPEDWEADEGYRPHVALTPERRALYKKHGFSFKKDGSVEFDPSKLL